MEKAIPPGINYADIKPEAIENQIRITKFTPIATIQQAQPNDIVRFHLQGNGFYDPYSAYLRLEIQVNDLPVPTPANPFVGKFLDRSAHSLFNRLVIRSQGTELERIEQYDVMAAMINDMVYSHEQRILHHYEGFATGQSCRQWVGPAAEQLAGEDFSSLINLPQIMPEAQPALFTHFGDYGVWKMHISGNSAQFPVLGGGGAIDLQTYGTLDFDRCIGVGRNGVPIKLNDIFTFTAGGNLALQIGYQDHLAGMGDNAPFVYEVDTGFIISSPQTLVFNIPIYSGIIGVLMPEKKFLPMSLLPLEIEFTVNPHAFYPVGEQVTNRRFILNKCEIWTHTLFFEQELHRSLEAVVAESGVFIHYTSFYLTPINTYNAAGNSRLPQYNQLGVYLKSISAVHWVYLYSTFEADDGPRKLHFVCHNMSQLQLRNGMDLIPSEPIMAQTGANSVNAAAVCNDHSQLLIEMYKAWNKMHQPETDSAITAFNFNLDFEHEKPTTIAQLLYQQTLVGRCQYGLTLEGEQLGQNRQIVAGKKSTMPFDINAMCIKSASRVSYMFCYLRADFIVYVRPDLVVTRLGV